MTAPSSVGFAALTLRRSQVFTWTIRLCFCVGVISIGLALWNWGAVEVRGHLDQVMFLDLVGVVWLLASIQFFGWFGLSLVDDAIERSNPAALVALCGAMLAVAMIYAAGNLGEGPSYWNNIFSAGLGTIGLFGAWCVLEATSHISISIAEERDFTSGVRICGFLLAGGLILGRSIAGDWHSSFGTVEDFLQGGWPFFAISFLAIVIELFVRPRRAQPFPSFWSHGLLPGIIYVAIASFWLFRLGWWEGMP